VATEKEDGIMKSVKRIGATAAGALAACAIAAGAAYAQSYPTKPVRIINPFSPGGSLDLVARTLAKSMSAELGQQVLVENRPGAGGTIGVQMVAKSPPDGYTLLAIQSSITVNPTLQPNIGYDPVRDLEPISKIASYMFFLVAHPSLPARSVKELIALARKNPGEVNYASVGMGSGTHLAAELFNHMAGVKMTHVPYKGTGQVMPDLLGGHIALHFGSTTVVPHVQAGKLVPLAVTGEKRSPVLPKVPTVAESGLKGYEVTAWNAMFAPAGTPAPIVSRLNALVHKGLQLPETRALLEKQGLDVDPSTPAELGMLVRTELEKWAKVIKVAGIKAD
jgi:tripartite-type tricarboxylate transporter receptor subunit TctC